MTWVRHAEGSWTFIQILFPKMLWGKIYFEVQYPEGMVIFNRYLTDSVKGVACAKLTKGYSQWRTRILINNFMGRIQKIRHWNKCSRLPAMKDQARGQHSLVCDRSRVRLSARKSSIFTEIFRDSVFSRPRPFYSPYFQTDQQHFHLLSDDLSWKSVSHS